MPESQFPPAVETRIHTVRGQRVMLDSDLAVVYGVETKAMNRAVKRNSERFPEPFAFQLLVGEWDILRRQIGTSSLTHGGRRYLPWVFTEHGAVMLATVLNSDRAIRASLAVVDAFVRLRHVLDANQELARRIDALAARVDKHDRAFLAVFEELKRLAGNLEPEPARGRVGFRSNQERGVTAKGKKGSALLGAKRAKT